MLGCEGSWNRAPAVDKRPWSSDCASPSHCTPSWVVRASDGRTVGVHCCDGGSLSPAKRQRNGVDSVCNAFSKRRKTPRRDSEKTVNGTVGCCTSDGLQLSPDISSPGSDSIFGGVDVPISLHPHTEQLYQQFFPSGDTAESRILQVFPPKIEVIRRTVCQDDEEWGQICGLGETSAPSLLEGRDLVLMGQTQAELASDTGDDGRWHQHFDMGGSDGENTPIRLFPSIASVRLPADRHKERKCPVVPLISVKVGSCGYSSFIPPPPVFQAPAPTGPDSSRQLARPPFDLDLKPYRMLGPVGIVPARNKAGSQVKDELANRVLVPIERDPARTNGAVALLGHPHSTRDAASRPDTAVRRKLPVLQVDSVPLVIHRTEPSAQRARKRTSPRRQSGSYGIGGLGVDGWLTVGHANEKVENEEGYLGHSSQNTITEKGSESSDTISNSKGNQCRPLHRTGLQPRWNDVVFKDLVSQIDMHCISDPMTSYLVRLDVSLSAAIKSLDATRILLVLDHLVSLPLRFVHLKGSGVGGTVMGLRRHWHPEVVKSARALVRRWRWTVQQQWQASWPFSGRTAERSASNTLQQMVTRLERLMGDIDGVTC